jgi:hypothetical protein
VLTGLVATDSSNHLNFYADETFTNPTQLLANVGFFDFPQATATTPAASGPTTAYLTVHPPGTSPYSGTGGSVYRIDSKGTLSADLYDFQGMVTRGLTVVDQDHAYLIDGASVVEIAQGVAQTLYTFPDNRAQFLGYVAQHLIFQTSTGGAANTLQSLAAGSPGAPVTIGNYSQNTVVTLLGNSLLVSHYPAAAASEPASTELLDASGTALRPLLPGSAFVSSSSPALMANHIPGPTLAGGEIDVLDLSQSNTSGPALKNASGSTYTLPSGANSVDLHQVTATVGIGSMKASTEGSVPLEYDLSSGVITPVTFANTKLSFVGF